MIHTKPIVTGVINLHREGELLRMSFRSVLRALRQLSASGVTWEMLCVLDRADDLTRNVLQDEIAALVGDSECVRVLEVQVGDLGLSRNAAVCGSHGDFIGFIDGDDLCSADWFSRAHRRCAANPDVIAHPELNIYFGRYSGLFAHPNQAESDLRTLFFNNLWTALSFASRSIYEKLPYNSNEVAAGLGYEDWNFNCRVIEAGYQHVAVRETAHFIRLKQGDQGLCDQTARNFCVIKGVGLWNKLSDCRSAIVPPDRESDAYRLVGLDPERIMSTDLPTWLSADMQDQRGAISIDAELINISPRMQNNNVLNILDTDLIERISSGIEEIHFVASAVDLEPASARTVVIADQVPAGMSGAGIISLSDLEVALGPRMTVFVGTLLVQGRCKKVNLWDSARGPGVLSKLEPLTISQGIDVTWHQVIPGGIPALEVLSESGALKRSWSIVSHIESDGVHSCVAFGLTRPHLEGKLRVLFLVDCAQRRGAWGAQSTWYRVIGPGEALRSRGHEVFYGVLRESEWWKPLVANKLCDVVVLHRGHPGVAFHLLRSLTQRHGIPIVYEFDDNIISPDEIAEASHLSGLSATEVGEIAKWTRGNAECLAQCDAAIVATEELLERSLAHLNQSFLFHNFVPEFFKSPVGQGTASTLRRRSSEADSFSIFYGPGSLEHAVHLNQICPDLERVLERFPQSRFMLGGGLNVPEQLQRFGDRVVRVPRMCPQFYLQLIESVNLVIAPLVLESFSLCKSWIKALESAAVGVEWIGSALPSYERFAALTQTGRIVPPGGSWFEAISQVYENCIGGRTPRRPVNWECFINQRAEEYAGLLERIVKSATEPKKITPFTPIANCQLYWSGDGEDFTEARSLIQEISSDGIISCEFDVPFSGVSKLRLDPVDRMGRIELLEFTVRSLTDGEQIFRLNTGVSAESLAIGGAHIPIKCASRIIFIARDSDPKVILSLASQDSCGVRVKIAMNISLKDSDIYEVGGRWRHVRRLVSAAGGVNFTPFKSLGS